MMAGVDGLLKTSGLSDSEHIRAEIAKLSKLVTDAKIRLEDTR